MVTKRILKKMISELEKLDLYKRKENPVRRRRSVKVPECLCNRCQLDQAACPYYQACPANQEDV